MVYRRFNGIIAIITRQIMQSMDKKEPLYTIEYIRGDCPLGALLAKKTTPDITWNKNLIKTAVTVPKSFLFLK